MDSILERFLLALDPHIQGIENKYETLSDNLKEIVDIYRTGREGEIASADVQRLLVLIEPYFIGNESVYDILTESRQELVKTYRKLKPRGQEPISVGFKGTLPEFVSVVEEKPIKKPRKQSENQSIKSVETFPFTSENDEQFDITHLEDSSEKLLQEMGI